MKALLDWIGNIANILGILSAVISVIAWINAKKHAKKASKSLEVIQNYRKVELYTEVNKKLEQIRLVIRDVGTSRANNVQKRYKELETTVEEIIKAIPTKNSDLIDKMKEVRKEIRVNGDNNQKLTGQSQYTVVESIDYVMDGLKVLMEELRQEN